VFLAYRAPKQSGKINQFFSLAKVPVLTINVPAIGST
jgi:hypothetical protein